jgi:PAS domain S-box-containing protein
METDRRLLMQNHLENRKEKRHSVRVPVKYSTAECDILQMGIIISLSNSGAYLIANELIEVGEQVSLDIDFLYESENAAEGCVEEGRGQVKTCHLLPKEGANTYGIRIVLQDSLPNKDWGRLFPPSNTGTGEKSSGNGIAALRHRAENFIARNPQTIFNIKPEEIRQLVHELYIHQIELQMQGDELRQSQNETEQALAQYAELYDFAPVGYVTLNRRGVIEKHNITGAAMLGLERSRIVGKPLTQFICNADQDIFFQHRQAVRNTQDRQTCEIRLRHQSGSLFYVQLQSIIEPKKQEDGQQKIFLAVIDINDRKLAEQQHKVLQEKLIAAQKMEAIGTLAGGVAHDFNNLMMAIQGSVSVMRLDLGENHSHAKYLAGIETEIRSASRLTRQLLAFAQGGKYESRPIDINASVHTALYLFARTHRDIEIKTDLQEKIPAVAADLSQIEQMLLNLFINAGEAMPGGGRLTVRTRDVNLKAHHTRPHHLPAGDYICIEVTDTGTGMDDATVERIFEPFFSTKKGNRGNGLGLASAFGIMRNHRGFIEVASQLGEGTTFVLYLPATQAKAVKKASVRADTYHGTETILVVDDEPVVRKVVSKMLERLGYTVLLAGSGKEAVDHYQRHMEQIDLVLLDMTMPVMDGKETFIQLQSHDKDVKVILASGFSKQGKAEEIVARGCRGFLQKPYDLKELSRSLRSILDLR